MRLEDFIDRPSIAQIHDGTLKVAGAHSLAGLLDFFFFPSSGLSESSREFIESVCPTGEGSGMIVVACNRDSGWVDVEGESENVQEVFAGLRGSLVASGWIQCPSESPAAMDQLATRCCASSGMLWYYRPLRLAHSDWGSVVTRGRAKVHSHNH